MLFKTIHIFRCGGTGDYTENNNYQQVARTHCGDVIMKVIVMKLEMTCVPIIFILIARTNMRTLSLIKVSRKLAALLSTGLHHSWLIVGLLYI